MESLRNVICPFMKKVFPKNPEQDIACGYLAGEGDFADSAAILGPIRNEYRYLSNIGEALEAYRKIAGWDDFACRCVVLFCLTCQGYATSYAFPLEDAGVRQNLDAFVSALTAGGLPVRRVLP